MRQKHVTIGIIGFGNMGSAIAERVKSKYRLSVFDKDKKKTGGLKGIKVSDTIPGLVSQSDAVVLAVKPQDFYSVLNEIKDYTKGKLIISIAAGITTKDIDKILGKVRVIRVMPNMPAIIGKGMSCICKGKYAKEKDLEFAEKLFKSLGKTLVVREIMMNAATAISGSGPGYYYYLIEGDPEQYKSNRNLFKKQFISYLTAAAQDLGFSHPEARFLSIGTGNACDSLLEKSGLSPGELKKRVASKGGTTEAGLKVLKHNIRNLPKAVKAALRRAKELSRKLQPAR